MLEDMSPAEVEASIERVAHVFAGALMRTKGWNEAEALAKSREHLALRLPPDRAGHHFQNVVADGAVVGALWFEAQLDATPGQLYIYDIEISQEQRGRGFGTKALVALEERARELGAEQIGLAVFAYNTGAIRLYERLGYETIEEGAAGKQMAKRLS